MKTDSESSVRGSETPVVELEGVTKSFGSVPVVRDLGLSVARGTVHGILGPNGAGKTTTLRMILGIFHPDRGRVRVFGEEGLDWEGRKRRIGYLPEERGLYKKMRVDAMIRYFAALKRMNRDQTDREMNTWLERFDLQEARTKRFEELSRGMQQKVQIITTFIHRPELLILDEPFSGLDAPTVQLFTSLLIERSREGATILFSTHILEQAEKICHSLCLIHRGEVVLEGKMETIRRQEHSNRVEIEFEGDRSLLPDLPGVEEVHDWGRVATLTLTTETDPQEILRRLCANGRVHRFLVQEPSLSDIFLSKVGEAPPSMEPEHG